MKIRMILAIACACFLSSCEKEEEDELDALSGDWNGACLLDTKEGENDSQAFTQNEEEEQEPEYSRMQVKFDGKGALTAAMGMFSDAACASKNFGIDLVGTYTIGNDTTTPAGAKELDLIWSSVSLTISNADYVGTFNQHKFCGFEDFVVNVAKDVSTANCGEGNLPKANSTEYDIFKIEGSSLFLGDKDESPKKVIVRLKESMF